MKFIACQNEKEKLDPVNPHNFMPVPETTGAKKILGMASKKLPSTD